MLSNLVQTKRIMLTMGPGGVGKTSIAAAIGLQAACDGRRALVLTLDPALRLANALGLRDVPPGQTKQLSVQDLTKAGIPATAPLAVEMLDTHKAWENSIKRQVLDPQHRDKILEHPFFISMSQDLAGAREYAACEELYHLYLYGGYDLVILDTPPTIHGVDFLDAPERILEVLETGSYRWLMRPALLAGKMGLKVMNFSGGYVVRTLARFTGLDFLRQLAGFVDLFSSLLEGFRQRASAVQETLSSTQTAFVMVTTADPKLSQETAYLYRQLKHRKASPQALVVNRMTPLPQPLPDQHSWQTELINDVSQQGYASDQVTQSLAEMLQAHQILTALATRDRTQFAHMQQNLFKGCALQGVDIFDNDIHDLNGLEQLRKALFTSD